jgi:hypothetical protein
MSVFTEGGKMKTILLMLSLLLAASAQAADDPFAGKWILDVQRSQYPTGDCPTSMTIEMESVARGVRYRSDTTFANGRESHSEYTADYDGNQAMVMGARGMMLPVFLKRIDARTVVASYTKDLVIVAVSRRVVSEDGRSMIVTTESKDAAGTSVTTVAVFERQERSQQSR